MKGERQDMMLRKKGGIKPELAIVRVSNRAKMEFKSTQHLPGGSRWPGCEGLLSGL